MSSVSSAASSSKCFSTRSASFSSRFCRSKGLNFDQGPVKARRAASTARSMSSASPSATRARTSPVEGLMVSKVLPEAGGLDPFAVDQHALRPAVEEGMARGQRGDLVHHGLLRKPLAGHGDGR
jgi:hypothetical protein